MPEPRAFNPSNPGFFGPIASVALRHGDTVYTSGLVGIDFRTGEPVSATDFGAQVRKALDNLKEVLESAGSSLDRVLSVRCWVSDWANWEAMNAIYVTYFTHEPKPVRATVEAGLLPPYMFEIQAIAYVGRARRPVARARGRRAAPKRRASGPSSALTRSPRQPGAADRCAAGQGSRANVAGMPASDARGLAPSRFSSRTSARRDSGARDGRTDVAADGDQAEGDPAPGPRASKIARGLRTSIWSIWSSLTPARRSAGRMSSGMWL